MDLKRWSITRWSLRRSASWRDYWEKRAPSCGDSACRHPRSLLRRLRSRALGVRLHGVWYCMPECLEQAVGNLLRPPRFTKTGTAAAHRIPLGLILLSRQQLLPEQLHAALEAQRLAGVGKIGYWLQRMEFITEPQLTSALARQWSCPVLRSGPTVLALRRVPEIPMLLLESLRMIPVHFAEATATLHVAFADGIDYSVLYAIERMLGCRTAPCLVGATVLEHSLLALLEHRGRCEIVFDRVADNAEFVRVLRSYAHRLAASGIRMAPCGSYVWLRLERSPRPTVSLLLRTPPVESFSTASP
jgi:Type II secretion system (T2SS), protein E, N-terminal domain